MNLKSLRSFLYVMDEGSLHAAAKKMFLSQPAVSRLIKLLEEELNVQLFYRDQKSLTPTHEAQLFYPEAKRVMSSVDDFPALFQRMRKSRQVPLRVICQMRASNGLVIPAIVEFGKRYPEIPISLDIHPRRELGRRLQEDKFDVGIYVMPLQVTGVELVKLREAHLQVLLPKDHHLAERPFLTPTDMVNEKYVALRRGLMAREAIDRALAKENQELEIFHEVSGTNAAHRFVAGGLGYTFSDPSVLEPNFAKQTILVPWQPEVKIDLGIYRSKYHNLHEHAEAFIECLDMVWEQRLGDASEE